MANDGFQVDPTALTNFAKALGSNLELVGQIPQLPNKYQSQIAYVNFGQDASDNSTPTGFTDADNLYQAYSTCYHSLIVDPNSSFNTFVTQLNALASVAATAAQRYKDAQDQDVIGPTDMDNLLNNPPSPSQPG